MASVHRKPNSPYWQMKYRAEDGRVVMRSTKQTNRKKALALANETERMATKARAGELTQAVILKNLGEMMERTTGEKLAIKSIEDFFTDYLESKKTAGSAKSTLERYKPIINGFLKSLPPARRKASIASVTPSEIEKFRDKELDDGKSKSTCDFALKVISSVLNQAHRKGLALTNPALAVDALKGIPEERSPFTFEQVKNLLGAADNEWTGMILFGYHAGLRLQDAANLTWENIDLESQRVTFRERKTANRKRVANPVTTIVLHNDVVEWLSNLNANDNPKSPIFPSLMGIQSGSARGLSNMFNDIMLAAKIEVKTGRKAGGKGRTFRKLGFHSLRHSMISNLANADVSADVRMAMSGHSSDEIHRRYVHLDDNGQREAVKRIPSLM